MEEPVFGKTLLYLISLPRLTKSTIPSLQYVPISLVVSDDDPYSGIEAHVLHEQNDVPCVIDPVLNLQWDIQIGNWASYVSDKPIVIITAKDLNADITQVMMTSEGLKHVSSSVA